MAAVAETLDTVQSLTETGYKWGFETDIEMDVAPKGLNEDTIRMISARKDEPEWLLAWRLKAYAAWLKMDEPDWAKVGYPPIDYQDIHYYAAPKKKDGPKSLDEVDPELLRTYEKLGIPLKEQAILAGVVGAEARTARHQAADRGGRRVRQRFRRDHVPQEPVRGGRDLLPDQRGGARAPGAGAPVPRQRGAGRRQLLRRPEQRRVHRRLVRVHPQGRALPDGAVHLLPHQCQEHRASSSAR